jgi:hypothetical protein
LVQVSTKVDAVIEKMRIGVAARRQQTFIKFDSLSDGPANAEPLINLEYSLNPIFDQQKIRAGALRVWQFQSLFENSQVALDSHHGFARMIISREL